MNNTYISPTPHIYHKHYIYISQTSHVSQYITNKFTSNPRRLPPAAASPTIFVQSPAIKKSKPISTDKQEVLRKRCKINKT